MQTYVEKIQQLTEIERRDFVKVAAASAAALAASSALAGCSNKVEPVEGPVETAEPQVDPEEGATWVSAACWHNCGGRCVNKVLVKDGVVLRQKTDDTHEDSYDYPQIRGCARGRSQRRQVFGADRLKYPMKRAHWEPLTGGDKSLRGRDEWERISWDEALDYVAAEIKNVIETYGNRAIYCPSGDQLYYTLAAAGGYMSSWCTSSVGNWAWANQAGYGMIGRGGNDRYDIFLSDYVVMIGCNPAWSAAGNPTWYYKNLKDAGVTFIAVDPFYNESYDVLDAQWIPVYPGSDVALLLGVAHTMIAEDAERGLIDWDFLNTYASGFDEGMMPEGADPKENFKDYVLGTYDDEPKTADWASERCGVSAEQIRELAYVMGKQNNVALLAAFAPGRFTNAEYFPFLFGTVGMMGGHMGKPGNQITETSNGTMANQRSMMFVGGDRGLPALENPITEKVNDVQVWEAILSGKYHFSGGSTYVAAPAEERDIDIHLIYHGGLNGWSQGQEVVGLQTKPNIAKGIEAHRKVDFVVANAFTLNTQAAYADIVLPVTTEWERPGRLLNNQVEALIFYQQVVEPLYEAQSDQWVAEQLASRLGLDPKAVFPLDMKQQYFNELAGTTVISADATGFEPLVTITQADIDEWGVEGTAQEGRIGLTELLGQGIYQVPRSKDDVYSSELGYAAFINDPAANPLKTPSGKFEIHCATFRTFLETRNHGEGIASAIPVWQPQPHGHEGTLSGDYPYQVFNPHYLRRSHSTFDQVGQLRNAFKHPVFINAQDAAGKGVKTGDTVLIFNDNGKTLRLASVTNRLTPGVIALPHGGWVDIDEETGIDRGGADNILCGSYTSKSGVTGWNATLADFEKYSGPALEPDVEWPQRIPIKEA
ncbi:MAG: molybdopterin-dependent oxidoreductase [Coriobacteriales bacterium]|jgi:anaerobic dimethyl sulfoxide reductase subunit A|nr:molybdopterin-dependent oxidoreductase [Coriobacteriales bacterium]